MLPKKFTGPMTRSKLAASKLKPAPESLDDNKVSSDESCADVNRTSKPLVTTNGPTLRPRPLKSLVTTAADKSHLSKSHDVLNPTRDPRTVAVPYTKTRKASTTMTNLLKAAAMHKSNLSKSHDVLNPTQDSPTVVALKTKPTKASTPMSNFRKGTAALKIPNSKSPAVMNLNQVLPPLTTPRINELNIATPISNSKRCKTPLSGSASFMKAKRVFPCVLKTLQLQASIDFQETTATPKKVLPPVLSTFENKTSKVATNTPMSNSRKVIPTFGTPILKPSAMVNQNKVLPTVAPNKVRAGKTDTPMPDSRKAIATVGTPMLKSRAVVNRNKVLPPVVPTKVRAGKTNTPMSNSRNATATPKTLPQKFRTVAKPEINLTTTKSQPVKNNATPKKCAKDVSDAVVDKLVNKFDKEAPVLPSEVKIPHRTIRFFDKILATDLSKAEPAYQKIKSLLENCRREVEEFEREGDYLIAEYENKQGAKFSNLYPIE